jgi:hypothetical protein
MTSDIQPPKKDRKIFELVKNVYLIQFEQINPIRTNPIVIACGRYHTQGRTRRLVLWSLLEAER